MSWLTTTDHKRIGVMYAYFSILFFVIGGLEALLIRIQLWSADSTFLSAAEYNTMMTMHGTTMVFLFVMPIAAAFFNYVMPLQIGARDVAFPRLNALSLWIFVFGAIFISSSFLIGTAGAPIGGNLAEPISRLGAAPNGGWFGYAPNSLPSYSTGNAMDFWSVGLQIVGLASLISSVNFIVTIFSMRAKGMKLMRMPIFTWMTLVVSFLLLFSLPIITVALLMVTFDRQFGTTFFDATAGGDPILWQHLFWLFGHPEVYILVLPAMGAVSEVLPTNARKPLFGYGAVVFAGAAIGFLGFGVWAHHMYSSGITPVAQAAFGLATMSIAVPTGIKIFNWIGTLWGGKLRFPTPMLFALGFIFLFIIGGLSGVTHSVVPANWQHTDTYYVVGHFHFVLFGGAVMGLFAGVYHWWPMVHGRMPHRLMGKIHFWLMFIGMNLTFGPMHWLGLQGQPRRTAIYSDAALEFWNRVSTIGAFTIGIGVSVFIANWIWSKRHGERVTIDPWDARTLEWTLPLPVPEYNFAVHPEVHSLDDFWHTKYAEEGRAEPADGSHDRVPGHNPEGPVRSVRRENYDEILADLEYTGLNPTEEIELPSQSYFPILASFFLMVLGFGVVYIQTGVGLALFAIGAIGMVGSFVGWAVEPVEEHLYDDPHDDDHGDEGTDPDGEPDGDEGLVPA